MIFIGAVFLSLDIILLQSGNRIQFLSGPSLRKSEGLLFGCNYTTSRNAALPLRNFFWLFNGTTRISPTGPVTKDGFESNNTNYLVFSFPSLSVDDDKWVGSFTCGIQIGSQSVLSAEILIHEVARGKCTYFLLVNFDN